MRGLLWALMLMGCGGDYAAQPYQPNLYLRSNLYRDGLTNVLDCPAWERGAMSAVVRWRCQPFDDNYPAKVKGIYRSAAVPAYWIDNPEQQVLWRWIAVPEKLSWLSTGQQQWFEGAGLVTTYQLEAVWL